MTRKLTLDRRTLLRGMLGGAAVGLGLPTLESMLSRNGDALASGAPLPDRFGAWFWGHGVRLEHWIPPTTGANWTPSLELAPLADFVPWVSVVSGCVLKTGRPHEGGMTGVWTGQAPRKVGTVHGVDVHTCETQTVDQDAADQLSAGQRLRSLEVGCSPYVPSELGTVFEELSHNGPNQPNRALRDPSAVYRRLVGLPIGNRARSRVLDAVLDDANRMRRLVGSADRARLDQHFEAVHELERALEVSAAACTFGDAPLDPSGPPLQDPMAERNELMSQLVALALSCDLTRVFSVQLGQCGGNEILWNVGATEGWHLGTHNEALPQPIVHASVVFAMEQLAVLLRRLRDTPDGDSNLLESVSIVASTDCAEGYTHSGTDLPVLLAGHGNGRLRGGIHYRSETEESVTKAVLTGLYGAGVRPPSWGAGNGYVTEPITDLLT